MAIPIRNTVREKTAAPFSMSYINTPAGASITGEIRKYKSYKEMVTDAQPARLASVLNASMDKDYDVPQEHQGGVLYQRDFVNNNWVLLYTAEDIAVPTIVDWSNIINIPPWVGGVSNNRVRMIANTYAKTRTTYYSFEDFILVLPDPKDVDLGDQIVLEQWRGQGAVCVPYVDGEIPEYELENIDATGATTQLYHVFYTYADYSYTRDDNGQMVIDESEDINHNSFMFICTENEMHARKWTLMADESIEEGIINIRQELMDHMASGDPHRQYIRKTDIGRYIDSMARVQYQLPFATYVKLGGVYIATDTDIAEGKDVPKVVNPKLMSSLLKAKANQNHSHYVSTLADVDGTVPPANESILVFDEESGKWKPQAATAHRHPLSTLADVDASVSEVTHGQVLVYDSSIHGWVPHTLSETAVVYGSASHLTMGLVRLAEASDVTQGTVGAYAVNAQLLSSVLSGYMKTNATIKFKSLEEVSVESYVDGQPFVYSNGHIVQAAWPTATLFKAGIIQVASSTDISAGTVVDNKAVTPVQLVAMSSAIHSEVVDMVQHSGYILPSATTAGIGGVRLITDAAFNYVVAHADAVTDVYATVNPMQVGSHLRAAYNNAVSAADQMVSALASSVITAVTSLASATQINDSAIGKINPRGTVLLWHGDTAVCSSGGEMEDYRLCDGSTYVVSNASLNVSSSYVTPVISGPVESVNYLVKVQDRDWKIVNN